MGTNKLLPSKPRGLCVARPAAWGRINFFRANQEGCASPAQRHGRINFFRANQRFVSYQPRPKAWVYFGIFTQANGLPNFSSLAASALPAPTTVRLKNFDAGADDTLFNPFALRGLKLGGGWLAN